MAVVIASALDKDMAGSPLFRASRSSSSAAIA